MGIEKIEKKKMTMNFGDGRPICGKPMLHRK